MPDQDGYRGIRIRIIAGSVIIHDRWLPPVGSRNMVEKKDLNFRNITKRLLRLE